MSVYVDALFPRGMRLRGRDVDSCHMLADTVDELHAMAERIGMKRSWYQPKSSPHYDLTPSRRAAAVAAGAVEVDRHQLVAIIRRLRSVPI
jgi:hypothetical protein